MSKFWQIARLGTGAAASGMDWYTVVCWGRSANASCDQLIGLSFQRLAIVYPSIPYDMAVRLRAGQRNDWCNNELVGGTNDLYLPVWTSLFKLMAWITEWRQIIGKLIFTVETSKLKLESDSALSVQTWAVSTPPSAIKSGLLRPETSSVFPFVHKN